MKKLKTCLIDLDDTLADMKQAMMSALNKATGKYIHWSKWNTYDVPALYGIEYEKFLQICRDEQVIHNVVINESSENFLSTLKMLGFYNVLITARGWHPDGKKITEQWVTDHGLCVDEIILVESNQSKIEVIEKFDNIEFSVDDRIKHCREYKQTKKVNNVFVCDAPWNTHMSRWNPYCGGFDYDMRVNNLNEIVALYSGLE